MLPPDHSSTQPSADLSPVVARESRFPVRQALTSTFVLGYAALAAGGFACSTAQAVAASAPKAPSMPLGQAASQSLESPVTHRLKELEGGYEAALERDVAAPNRAAVANLDAQYLEALNRTLADVRDQKEGDALLRERLRVVAHDPLPAVDDPSFPRSLRNLRLTYRDALAKIDGKRETDETPLREKYHQVLVDYQLELTKAGNAEGVAEVTAWIKKLDATPLPGFSASREWGKILAGTTWSWPSRTEPKRGDRISFDEQGNCTCSWGRLTRPYKIITRHEIQIFPWVDSHKATTLRFSESYSEAITETIGEPSVTGLKLVKVHVPRKPGAAP